MIIRSSSLKWPDDLSVASLPGDQAFDSA